MAHHAPPALAKSKSQKAHGGLKWDEQNLEENEKVKAELPPVKITEPKTPYHQPLQGDEADLEPLDLDLPAGHHHHANEAAADKHADFEAARKRHYMKEALAASRKMIEEELKAEEGSS